MPGLRRRLRDRRRPVEPEGTRLDLPSGYEEAVASALLPGFFAPMCEGNGTSAEDYLATELGAADLQQHVRGRVEGLFATLVPWLASGADLAGASVLEVGCGTGASTLSLALAGCDVIALEVDAPAAEVARVRLEAARCGGTVITANGEDLLEHADPSRADIVLLHAVIEHMTMTERHQCLASLWPRMRPGTLLVVTDTPNRLWYFDDHTSLLPFFHWLPDELAARYTERSPRALLVTGMGSGVAPSRGDELKLARWGRGVSFHDFEIALDRSADDLRVVGQSMNTWLRAERPSIARGVVPLDVEFGAVLRRIMPSLDPAWLESSLDLRLRR